MFIDFESGTNGSNITTSNILGSVHGTACSSWSNGNTSQITYATAGQLANLLALQTVGGTQYNGSGSLGMQYTTATSTAAQILCFLNTSSNSITAAYWIEWNIPNADTEAYDMFEIASSSGTQHYSIALFNNGVVKLETPSALGGTHGLSFTPSPNTLYWFIQTWNSGTNVNDSLAVYNSSGTLIASVNSGTFTASSGSVYLGFGTAGDLPQTASLNWWMDNVLVAFSNNPTLGLPTSSGPPGAPTLGAWFAMVTPSSVK